MSKEMKTKKVRKEKKAAVKEQAPKQEEVASVVSTLPLNFIADHPEVAPFRDLDKKWAQELSESIENEGLDTPITVWQNGKMKVAKKEVDGTFLVAGRHRREALKLLKKRNPARFDELFPNGIPVIVRSGTPREMLCLQVRENVNRKDMTAAEIFPRINSLINDHKMKQVEVAAAVGKSEAWVSQMLSIATNLPEEAVESIKKGELDVKEAREIATTAKKAKKAGKPLQSDKVKKLVDQGKARTKQRKEQGRERSDKRVGAKTLWQRYQKLPKMSVGTKYQILEGALEYLAGKSETLPDQLQDPSE